MTQIAPAPVISAPNRIGSSDARSNEVTAVKILLGFQTSLGVQHAIHEINPEEFIIDGYSFHTNKKTSKVKEGDGSITIEPTGEEELTLKIKYHRR